MSRSVTTAGSASAAVAALLLLAPQASLAKDKSSAEITPPQPIAKYQRPPQFPPAAKAARFQGEVTLRVNVLPTGMPDGILVVHSSHPKVGFEEAAVAAVERWRFVPAMRAGVPVPYEALYTLTFGRRGVGLSGIADLQTALSRRTDVANRVGAAPTAPPQNTGSSGASAGSRRPLRRR